MVRAITTEILLRIENLTLVQKGIALVAMH